MEGVQLVQLDLSVGSCASVVQAPQGGGRRARRGPGRPPGRTQVQGQRNICHSILDRSMQSQT